ncbi:ammonia channel protein [Nitrosopumilus sp. b1]|uniref:ammonium transporter n=1 Tax=Nitrosopumilus sp. b1 TaxID=2109907 RepID=UPI000E2C5E93|nr:ammonium transporter [Nitrosopumilus sp. b1]RDJ31858.1 MAG: ammonium transporter [Thermoproteota archaeon]KAF6243139.1 ammonia channel protein [Nitrosopumilus sp. b1]RDJ34577.1 MAG: ammonium transporter [Thermoproteota archaeon]RDJ35903.1 MAG: ammonium transporter [Thermoproteota archaeon]RDJ38480.1 MAG: ammonium transporter [Thermoproteota archaeon]
MAIDTGDTAWMLVAGSLVLLMIPALGMFESGLMRKKNTVSVFMQIFFGLALLSVMWFAFGFSLSFGPDTMGVVGNLDWTFLRGIASDGPLEQYAPTIPGMLFVKFQLMFAAITPLLLTGVIAERMKFSSFIIFIAAWSMLIYYPLVHWVWGGGWLAQMGVVDFAGGIVIHTSVGMGALAAALVLGRRRHYGPSIMVPHSIPLAVIGSSLLWLGWFGFNAGSALASGGLAGNTVIVTHLASSVSALIWVGLSWMRTGKPSVIAAVNGAIAGLAGITPASGFVSVEHSFVIGIAIGIASYSGVVLFKEKLKIDDALDVSSVHGVAGIIGSLAIGIFASSMINPSGPDGFLFGNPDQMLPQAIGVGVAAALGFGGTWIIMQVIKHLIGIRVTPEVEDAGLDISEHAESAYSDEEEFRLDMDDYVKDKEESDEFFFKKR